MKQNRQELYLQKYAHEVIHIDGFSAAKMGLIQSQTMLKIDKLQLICSPFQLSMQKAVLLGILSERELPFFKHYTQKLTSLRLRFDKSELNQQPLKLMLWARINRLIPLQGRQNLCMVDLNLKSCPNDLIDILGRYIDMYKTFQNLFVRYRGREISISPETNQLLKFNNYAEAYIKKQKVRVKLLLLSVNRLLMVIPAFDACIKAGLEFESKLYFQQYRFKISGKIEKTSPVKDGFIHLYYLIKFTPELVDIVHTYFQQNTQ